MVDNQILNYVFDHDMNQSIMNFAQTITDTVADVFIVMSRKAACFIRFLERHGKEYKRDTTMSDQKFTQDTMNKINIMQVYKDQYGEDDIHEYFKTFGTWRGIEGYLSECKTQRQAQNAETS